MTQRSSFLIDLAACTGCFACSVACKDRAGLPDEYDLVRVEEHTPGAYPKPGLFFRVVHCFHCANAPCVAACPSDAMSHADDGLVVFNEAECVNCGKCAEACPFDAITMLPADVPAKCDACADEVARGWEPTCVRACPTRALDYGSGGDDLPEHRVQDTEFDTHEAEPSVVYVRRPPQEFA